MFAKPVFSALNTVTCSSAISKGFFQSHLCGNLSFCDAYESPVKCPGGERVEQTALTMSVTLVRDSNCKAITLTVHSF